MLMPILHLMSPENLQHSKPNQTGIVFPKNISGISRISYVRWTYKKEQISRRKSCLFQKSQSLIWIIIFFVRQFWLDLGIHRGNLSRNITIYKLEMYYPEEWRLKKY